MRGSRILLSVPAKIIGRNKNDLVFELNQNRLKQIENND